MLTPDDMCTADGELPHAAVSAALRRAECVANGVSGTPHPPPPTLGRWRVRAARSEGAPVPVGQQEAAVILASSGGCSAACGALPCSHVNMDDDMFVVAV